MQKQYTSSKFIFKKFKLGDAVSFFDKSSSVVHIRFDNSFSFSFSITWVVIEMFFFDNIGRYIVKIYRVNPETSARSNIFTTRNC